jgi:hypothetical protein
VINLKTAKVLGLAQAVMLQSSLTALPFYRRAAHRSVGPPVKGFGITSGYHIHQEAAQSVSPIPRTERVDVLRLSGAVR